MGNKTALEATQDNSPAEMIRMAVAGNADLDKLEKLLALQERYEANESRKSYHEAMAEFKKNPPDIDKDKKVSFGNTHYNHASLANVVEKISAALSNHGLSASWTTKQNGVIEVTCKITHVKGHSETTSISAPSDKSGSKNDIQAIGSTITYLQRYTLLSLTGLATHDQDDDAQTTTEVITKDQVNFIVDSLADLNMPLDGFLKFMKVENIETMPAVLFKKAEAAITAKRNAVKK